MRDAADAVELTVEVVDPTSCALEPLVAQRSVMQQGECDSTKGVECQVELVPQLPREQTIGAFLARFAALLGVPAERTILGQVCRRPSVLVDVGWYTFPAAARGTTARGTESA